MEMNQAKQLMEHRRKLAVVGMGYVGLPLALAFAKHFDVIGFDVNEAKIHQYRSGADPTGEVGCEALRTTACHFTSNPEDLKEAGFYIISVPTPVDEDNQPDFSCLISASRIVGNALKPGDIVVYESTVFPGATEEICIPELEIHAGLSCPEELNSPIKNGQEIKAPDVG